jgi:hypothetical protein
LRNITVINRTQNFIQHSTFKVSSIHGWNYFRTSVSILMLSINFRSNILRVSVTGETDQSTMGQYISYFKKARISCRREVLSLYSIFIEFGVTTKLVMLIMCLKETYSKVCIGKHMSGAFTEMLYHHCFWIGHVSFWSVLMVFIYWANI